MTWQTAQPARVNRSLKDSSPVTNGTLSGVSRASAVSFGVVCGEGARSVQTIDSETNAMAVHTTAGLGDRGSGFSGEDSKAYIKKTRLCVPIIMLCSDHRDKLGSARYFPWTNLRSCSNGPASILPLGVNLSTRFGRRSDNCELTSWGDNPALPAS